ncbi:hypothetical protein [Eggerthella sp. YY7918]|uniref:hypothetical protein n=1 Tax=Eggerthella sp. (strain YY7918) TaxID=502558 RepID=UPI0002171373|nr:hypothetical protein [Eggerthella sp. YY7918]BAK44819.1 permease of the major facilitator superfamily [Eggerthella sp. YY7918]
MSKKKLRAFTWAMVTALAFVPFLSGCATNDAATNEAAQQEVTADEQDRNAAEGTIGEDVQYGQVMAVNGDQVTVVLGELTQPDDGAQKAFTSGQDEIVFGMNDVDIVDESGMPVDSPTLMADDVIIMKGTGEGSDFKPTTIEVLQLTDEGMDAGNTSQSGNSQ